ncbi:MAG: PHP domain-containing protein [Candidatus Cloacimonadota bacterium]|nr:PHP domain-containing protein [Candidatus Cloacimonadota bacterium]
MKQKEIFGRKFFELSGSIHNHSIYSYDSNVPIKTIVEAARKSSLDYFTLNDHFSVGAAKDEYLKKVKDITIIVGSEIYDKAKNNHLLVYNSEKIYVNKDAKYYLKKYKEEDAICLVAHPIEKRKPKPYRKYPWSYGFSKDIDGIEIWNYSSMWLDKVRPKLNGLLLIFFPWLSITKPYKETLKLWDKFSQRKKIVAFGSSDAHGTIIKRLFMKIPVLKHSQIMKSIRTNVLIEEGMPINQATILQGIVKGNSYIVNYNLGNPFDFYSGICKKNGNGIIPGESLDFEEGLKLFFKLPKIANVKLVYNGKIIKKISEDKGYFEIKKSGRYRLEITRYSLGWIYTNNFYIK